MSLFHEPPPLSLYVHLPWCTSKCPYCDFNSHALRGQLRESEYIDALLVDLDQHLCEVEGRRLDSVYIGGGTPSLFSTEGIGLLIAGIRSRFPCKPDAEVTLEANPDSAETRKFRGFREAGVNRLSLGIQSFVPRCLQRLGRAHDNDEALSAVAAANASGFNSTNLDMMFGLPGQTLEEALKDVDAAVSARPSHLSYYQMTIEADTRFHRRPPRLPDAEEIWRMQRAIQSKLRAAGYVQYEVSAYAKNARRCRHNLNYWRFGDYLGIGAGAHSKISHPNRVLRIWKVQNPKHYIDRASTNTRIAGSKELTAEDRCFEFLMNALRLKRGFTTPLFERRTGLPAFRLFRICEPLQLLGLLSIDGTRIRTTSKGFHHLDELLLRLLPETPPESAETGTPEAVGLRP